jgi:hypothetical protein
MRSITRIRPIMATLRPAMIIDQSFPATPPWGRHRQNRYGDIPNGEHGADCRTRSSTSVLFFDSRFRLFGVLEPLNPSPSPARPGTAIRHMTRRALGRQGLRGSNHLRPAAAPRYVALWPPQAGSAFAITGSAILLQSLGSASRAVVDAGILGVARFRRRIAGSSKDESWKWWKTNNVNRCILVIHSTRKLTRFAGMPGRSRLP